MFAQHALVSEIFGRQVSFHNVIQTIAIQTIAIVECAHGTLGTKHQKP